MVVVGARGLQGREWAVSDSCSEWSVPSAYCFPDLVLMVAGGDARRNGQQEEGPAKDSASKLPVGVKQSAPLLGGDQLVLRRASGRVLARLCLH